MIRKSFQSLLGLGLASTASADWALNMPKGVTEISQETYDLHMMIFWWCVAIGVVVFGVMIISLFKHRKSKGAEPASSGRDPADHGRACRGDDDQGRGLS
jgi:cytochrome c oxidase subunit 2